nr:sigma-70 family RNA polymerase sigma factor [uncultured Draconibacterium sp.]
METLEEIADIEIITSGNYEMEEVYEQVFPAVARLVSFTGGSFDDAKDIFHDALVIFMERDSQNPVDAIKSDKAYILGISKHLWIRKSQKDSHRISLSSMENEIVIPDDYFPTTNNKRLLNFLKIAGKRCLDLLRAFYFQQLPIKEIAGNLGYSNEHSVSVQKYKCLEKVRNTVKEKSLTYENFTE